jgi:hypothetical protein
MVKARNVPYAPLPAPLHHLWSTFCGNEGSIPIDTKSRCGMTNPHESPCVWDHLPSLINPSLRLGTLHENIERMDLHPLFSPIIFSCFQVCFLGTACMWAEMDFQVSSDLSVGRSSVTEFVRPHSDITCLRDLEIRTSRYL